MSGCEDDTPKETPPLSTAALSDEPSPNASILPEPLSAVQGPKIKKEGASPPADITEVSVSPAPRAVATPLQLGRELPDDPLRRGANGPGYTLTARIQFALSQSEVKSGDQSLVTWPRFQIELLKEQAEHSARLRAVLASSVFGFPESTEIRMRADRLGAIVVWPDQRSYRQLAVGSFSSLFADRRVDRMPFVEAVLREENPASQLTKKTRHLELSSTLGVAHWEMTELADLPYAAPLLCQMLSDMIRIAPSPELCKEGYLPIKVTVQWRSGGSFVFEVTNYSQKKDLRFDDFRMPPALPIYKRGELPPFAGLFLRDNVRAQLLPIKTEGEALAPPPPPPPPAPVIENPEAGVPALGEVSPRRPADEIELLNTTDRPLFVILDRVPYMWLPPGASQIIRVRGASVRYSATDFFGQKQFDPGTIVPPAQVRFGPEPVPPEAQ